MSKYQIHEDVMEIIEHIQSNCGHVSDHHEWNLDEHWDTRQLRDIKKVVNKLISKAEVG